MAKYIQEIMCKLVDKEQTLSMPNACKPGPSASKKLRCYFCPRSEHKDFLIWKTWGKK